MPPETTTRPIDGQAVARLTEHPWIDAVYLDGRSLRIRPAAAAMAVRPTPGPLVVEYLEHWTEVYDFTYASAGDRHADAPDLAGWRASDTGEPLAAEHMAQWIDRTVELVLASAPRHVLELGCGTGLLARRLAPHVAGYVGTDVAETTVARLAAGARAGTTFVRAAAHELASPAVSDAVSAAGFPAGRPDCVLINSVTQCFPDVRYLTAVVRDAIRLVAPGGVVFIGDNRHAGLLDAYCRWLESAADPDARPEDIAERARSRAARDDELNFDPAVLAAAAAGSGRDVRIAVYPKTMRADTELTRYRFDAVLHVDALNELPTLTAHAWTGVEDLRAAVSSGHPVRVHGIPNRLLASTEGAVTPHELRTSLSDVDAVVVLDTADPTRLTVVAPAAAAAAFVPASDLGGLTGHAHEPFVAFVARRIGETVRATLRRSSVDISGLAITVEPGTVAIRRAARAADLAVADVAADRLPGFLRDLDHVAVLAMAATIGSTGLCTAGHSHSAAAIADALRVAPRHRWILRRWLAVLVAEGLLIADDNGYHGLRPVSRTALVTAADDIDRARRGLGYPPELTRFFQTAVQYLPALLRDEVALQALLFADGETDTAEGAYRDNAVNRYVNAAAAEVVRWAAEWRRADRPFRVLEVGAGVGGTTDDVLAALESVPLDYLFTDVSRFFLVEAEKRFAGRAGMRYGAFDINADAATQGVAAGSLDVVLGANVLHNAQDIGATLRGLHALLAPGGLLVFVETTREIHQILTSMQFLMSARPGHDRPGARDRRAGTDLIFLDETEWTEELTAAGFAPLLCLPAPGHPLHPIGVQVFAAAR